MQICGCCVMLHSFSLRSCNDVAPGHAHQFDFQYPTCRNTIDASGWPNVRNMLHPTMLRYVAFKCCDRLAGACNVVTCFAEMLRSFGRGLARSRLSVCGDDRKRGRATSGIREKKAEGGPSLISPRPRSSPAHFFDHPH